MEDNIKNFTDKINKYVFELDQKLIQIDNYKKQIDTNSETILNIKQHTEEAVADIREGSEKEKQKALKEFIRIENKFQYVHSIIDDLPTAIRQCEHMCRNAEDAVIQIKKNQEDINRKNVRLATDKVEKEQYNQDHERAMKRLTRMENNYDLTKERTESLENWTDIYLPLKLQHQITDTIKECLPRQGKYMLGIADNIICGKLRDRVFKDVGKPELKERCLELIKQLRLDADILTAKDKQEVDEAKAAYQKCDEIGKQMPSERPLQSSVLQVDVSEHLGDQDQELVEQVKTQMEVYIQKQLGIQSTWTKEEMNQLQGRVNKAIDTVQGSLQNRDLDSNAFQMELKREVEALSDSTRRQSIENLTLMKGMTKTMQVLKDNDRFFKENDINTKEVLANMVEYFNQVNKLLNFKAEDPCEVDGIAVQGQKAVSTTFLTAMSKGRLSNNKLAESVMEKESSMIKQANDALKRLQISLFRNVQDTRMLRETTHARLGAMRHDSLSNQVMAHQQQNPYMTISNGGLNQGMSHFQLNSPSQQSLDKFSFPSKQAELNQRSGSNLAGFGLTTLPTTGDSVNLISGLHTLTNANSKNNIEEEMDGSRSSAPTEQHQVTPRGGNALSYANVVSPSLGLENLPAPTQSGLMNIMVANNDPLNPKIVNRSKFSTINTVSTSDRRKEPSLNDNLYNLDAKLNMRLNQMSTTPDIQPQVRNKHSHMHQSLDLKQYASALDYSKDDMQMMNKKHPQQQAMGTRVAELYNSSLGNYNKQKKLPFLNGLKNSQERIYQNQLGQSHESKAIASMKLSIQHTSPPVQLTRDVYGRPLQQPGHSPIKQKDFRGLQIMTNDGINNASGNMFAQDLQVTGKTKLNTSTNLQQTKKQNQTQNVAQSGHQENQGASILAHMFVKRPKQFDIQTKKDHSSSGEKLNLEKSHSKEDTYSPSGTQYQNMAITTSKIKLEKSDPKISMLPKIKGDR